MKFKKLTPTKEFDQLSDYTEALDHIFEDDDIKNIAISGPYGSGKSSLLKAYEERLKTISSKDKYDKTISNQSFPKGVKFLYISLAHFVSTESEENHKDNPENIYKEKDVEGKILNQLIQQIPEKDITLTNFRVKRDIDKKKCLLITAGIVFVIFSFLYFRFFNVIGSWVDNIQIPAMQHYEDPDYSFARNDFLNFAVGYMYIKHYILTMMKIKLFSVLKWEFFPFLLIAPSIGILFWLIYELTKMLSARHFFKKLSIQGNEIELFNESNDSYFDKYLNEVIYLFEKIDNDVVIVFEDLDRFDSVNVFERLREINTLSNIRRKESGKSVLRFFLYDSR